MGSIVQVNNKPCFFCFWTKNNDFGRKSVEDTIKSEKRPVSEWDVSVSVVACHWIYWHPWVGYRSVAISTHQCDKQEKVHSEWKTRQVKTTDKTHSQATLYPQSHQNIVKIVYSEIYDQWTKSTKTLETTSPNIHAFLINSFYEKWFPAKSFISRILKFLRVTPKNELIMKRKMPAYKNHRVRFQVESAVK